MKAASSQRQRLQGAESTISAPARRQAAAQTTARQPKRLQAGEGGALSPIHWQGSTERIVFQHTALGKSGGRRKCRVRRARALGTNKHAEKAPRAHSCSRLAKAPLAPHSTGRLPRSWFWSRSSILSAGNALAAPQLRGSVPLSRADDNDRLCSAGKVPSAAQASGSSPVMLLPPKCLQMVSSSQTSH